MAEQPPDWDPLHPPDRVCIFCFQRAAYYVVWKYGVNCTCFEGKCNRRTKGLVGFEYKSGQFTKGGLFRIKSEAEQAFKIQEIERRAKEANPRAR